MKKKGLFIFILMVFSVLVFSVSVSAVVGDECTAITTGTNYQPGETVTEVWDTAGTYTFTGPLTFSAVTVNVWGAGGGGSDGGYVVNGKGGDGGGWITKVFSVSSTDIHSITVGSGGVGAENDGAAATDGGYSDFLSNSNMFNQIVAHGGKGGDTLSCSNCGTTLGTTPVLDQHDGYPGSSVGTCTYGPGGNGGENNYKGSGGGGGRCTQGHSGDGQNGYPGRVELTYVCPCGGSDNSCDGVDNNCDGNTDEGAPTDTCYLNGDGDNFGAGTPSTSCIFFGGTCGIYSGIYSPVGGDCDDADEFTYPGAPEICDGVDNQCPGDLGFGEVDEGSVCISAYWENQGGNEITTANLGDEITLVLENAPSGVSSWKFKIFESDSSEGNSDDVIKTLSGAYETGTGLGNVKAIASWTITQSDIDKAEDGNNVFPYQFYFEVSEDTGYTPSGAVIGSLGSFMVTVGPYESGFLEVDAQPTPQPCAISSANWNPPSADVGEQVTLEITTNSACNGETVDFSIIPSSSVSPSPSLVQTNGASSLWDVESSVNTYSFKADIGGTTKDSGLLTVTTPDFCVGKDFCLDYSEEDCDDNICKVEPVGLPDGFICDFGTNPTCGCEWDDKLGICKSWFMEENSEICHYTETTDSSCSEDPLGFLILSWTAEWGNTGDQNPPNCVEGTSGLIPCAAQAQLPLTSWFSMVATIMILGGFYFLSSRNKRKKVKK